MTYQQAVNPFTGKLQLINDSEGLELEKTVVNPFTSKLQKVRSSGTTLTDQKTVLNPFDGSLQKIEDVTPIVLVSIAITPVAPTMNTGETLQMTATGTYSDSSTENLTDYVIWSTGDEDVATISATGLVTAVGAGATTIEAVYGAITAPPTGLVVSPVWSLVGLPEISDVAALLLKITFDGDGTPWIAYNPSGTFVVAVKKFNGTSWVDAGTFNAIVPYTNSNCDLVFDGNTPYLIVANLSPARIYVFTLNDGNWEVVAENASLPSAVFSPSATIFDGKIYAAFSLPVWLGGGQWGNKAIVFKIDGGVFEDISGTDIDGNYIFSTSLNLKCDSFGRLFLAYTKNQNPSGIEHYINVKKYNDVTLEWESVGSANFTAPDTGLGITPTPSLAIFNDVPFVVYRDYSNGRKGRVDRYNSEINDWEPAAASEAQALLSTGVAGWHSIVATPPGALIPELFVAYVDDGVDSKLFVKKYQYTDWFEVGTNPISGSTTKYPSIGVFNNRPYVAYAELTYNYKATVKKYA